MCNKEGGGPRSARRIAALCALAFAGAATPGIAQEPQPCPLAELASLDMITLPSGTFEVPVVINGRSLPLLFDTGSNRTGITAETADELGLRRETARQMRMFLNNVPVTQEAKIDDIEIGQLRTGERWDVSILPNNVLAPTTYGLLGPDLFAGDDVEIDFYQGKFNVFRHNKCAGEVVYWTRSPYAALSMVLDKDSHIIAYAQLDGKPVKVGFDTGAANSVMSLEAAERLFGWGAQDPRLKAMATIRINNGLPGTLYTFPFAALDFDGLTVQNPQIALIPSRNFVAGRAPDVDIVMGMSVLRQLHLYIDYKEHNLYLTGAEAR